MSASCVRRLVVGAVTGVLALGAVLLSAGGAQAAEVTLPHRIVTCQTLTGYPSPGIPTDYVGSCVLTS